MSLKGKAINGAFWSALGDWSAQFLALVVYVVLARLLSPEDFGLIAIAGVYVALVQVFIDTGFSQALIQRENLEPGHLDTGFWTNVVLALAVAGLTTALAPILAAAFGEPELAAIIVALSPVFLLSALSATQQAILAREFRFRSLSVRLVAAALTGGAVAIALALLGYGVWSLVAQQLVSSGVGVIVLWRTSGWRPGLAISRRCFTELFSVGINVLGIRLLSFLNQRLDQLLIGYFLGTTPLGYYSVARKIFQIMTQLLIQSFSRIALPTFSRMQSDLPRLRRAYYRAIRLTTAISIPAFAAVLSLAPDVITVFFGQKWAASAPILQFLCIAGVLYGINFFNTPLLIALNRGRISFALHILNTAGNIIAFSVAVQWGIEAVAGGFAARALILAPPIFLIVRRVSGISLRRVFEHVRGSLLISIVMIVLIQALISYSSRMQPEPIVQLSLSIVTGFIFYVIGSLAFNRNVVTEIRSLLLPSRK